MSAQHHNCWPALFYAFSACWLLVLLYVPNYVYFAAPAISESPQFRLASVVARRFSC